METAIEKYYVRTISADKPSTLKKKAPLKPIRTVVPMKLWAVDIVGPSPLTSSVGSYILDAVDLFYK